MYKKFFTQYSELSSKLTETFPTKQNIFLRADLNVPLHEKIITDSFRLEQITPTIDFLLEKNARIHIGTHLGKPHGITPELSTEPLQKWLIEAGYAREQITMRENLRFDEREYQQSQEYAQVLSHDIDYYVDDAFGSAHRKDTSLTLLAEQFPASCRSIGLLMAKELHTLASIIKYPRHPLVFILGGGKVAEKLAAAADLLAIADAILLCPALTDIDTHPLLSKSDKVHLPCDYLVGKTGWEPPFHTISAEQISPGDTLISIGTQTLKNWSSIIKNAGTIVLNGPMGSLDVPGTTEELHTLLTMVTQSAAYTVAGGGDTLRALDSFHIRDKIGYCSTGGGSLLAYLSGQQLPALDSFVKK